MEQPTVGETSAPPSPRRGDGGARFRTFSPFSLITVYAASFFFSLHSAFTSYIDSSFLSTIFPHGFTTPWGVIDDPVGIIFSAGALLMLLVLVYAPPLIRKLGNHNMALVFVTTEILLLGGIAYFKSVPLSALLFLMHLATFPIIRFSLDLFLENASADATTGTIRGIFLTAGNLAWVIAPLGVGFLLIDGDYWKAYIAAAALMTVVWYLVADKLHFFNDPRYENIRFWESARAIAKNGPIGRIFISDFLLWFFYAWMEIYMPLYLHAYVGFSWQLIGIIFAVMLLPFVLFQYPLGRLADQRLGEKELLITGFMIMALSSVLIGVSTTLILPAVGLWMVALFVTRIGASMVEIMDETYFFKHIDGSNARILGFYRNAAPLALLVAPFSASIIFELRGSHAANDFRFLFVILGFVMLLGVWNAFHLKDTR
ncbi:MAG: MFS transporter [Minisyncoccota bacterium]